MKKVLSFIFKFIIPLLGIIYFYIQNKNIFLMIISIIIYIILYKRNKDIKINKWIYILSIIYSLFYIIGTIIETNYLSYFYNIFTNFYISLFEIYSFVFFLSYLLNELLNILNKIKKTSSIKANIKNFLIIFIILLIAYIPYLIICYPGLLDIDSYSVIKMIIGKWGITNQHPVCYILFLETIFFLNLGIVKNIFACSLVQMIIMSLTISYTLIFLSKRGFPKVLLILSLIFYILIPIFGYYSITMWKDILFSCFSLLLILFLYKYIFEKTNRLDLISIFILILLIGLFRNNGKLIVLFLSLIILIFYKKLRKKTLICLLLPSILLFIITGPFYNLIGITKANRIEALGIPVQQLFYTVESGKCETGEVYDYTINLAGGKEILDQTYNPYSIDKTKFSGVLNDSMLTKKLIIKYWIKGLFKYPVEYINSYLKSTYGFWYINTTGYTVINTFNKDDLIIVNYKHTKTFNRLNNYYNIISKIPLIKYLFKAATYLLIMLLVITLCLIKKNYNYIILVLVPFINWITIMLATPVAYNFRYIFNSVLCMPVYLFIIYKLFTDKTKKRR